MSIGLLVPVTGSTPGSGSETTNTPSSRSVLERLPMRSSNRKSSNIQNQRFRRLRQATNARTIRPNNKVEGSGTPRSTRVGYASISQFSITCVLAPLAAQPHPTGQAPGEKSPARYSYTHQGTTRQRAPTTVRFCHLPPLPNCKKNDAVLQNFSRSFLAALFRGGGSFHWIPERCGR